MPPGGPQLTLGPPCAANAASSLIELGYGARGCDEQPAKRPRVESGLAPHPAHHTPGKDPLEMRETPVCTLSSPQRVPTSEFLSH